MAIDRLALTQAFICEAPLASVRISQGFGEDLLGGGKYQAVGLKAHNGWDCKAASGTEVFAPYHGKVAYTGHDKLAGNILFMRTEPKSVAGKNVSIEFCFLHLQESLVKAGQEASYLVPVCK